MNDEQRKLAAKKRKHRAKVRTLARKMPSRRLHNAVIAIGFAADYDTGVTENFGVKTLAKMTAKRRLGRDPSEQTSESTLHRAIAELEQSGVLTVSRTDAGLQTANAYTLDYEWPAKKNAERPVGPEVIETDADWLASLEFDPEQPGKCNCFGCDPSTMATGCIWAENDTDGGVK